MGRAPEVSGAKTAFTEVLEQADRLYQAVKPFCAMNRVSITTAPIHPKQANRFLGLAFLSILAGWEEFVEMSFMRYLAGSSTKTGYAPILRVGKCQSLPHAYEVFAGQLNYDPTKRFLNWSAFQNVIDKAGIFFANGEPFSRVSSQEIEKITDANKIRNRVAHASRKCKEEFRQTSLKLLNRSQLHQGFDAGMLLLHSPVVQFPSSTLGNLFEAYLEFFENLRDKIVP